jgi:hypothetical protein
MAGFAFFQAANQSVHLTGVSLRSTPDADFTVRMLKGYTHCLTLKGSMT